MNKTDKTKSALQPEAGSGLLLWLASNAWQRELKKVLDKHNLTHAQFMLLAGAAKLNATNKNSSQVAIASYTGIDKMMASKVLRTLEHKRMLKRKEQKSDTRAMQIEVTSFGKLTLSKADANVKKFDKSFFKEIAEKQKNFNKKLKALIE